MPIEIFKSYLDKIQDISIKEFTTYVLNNAPDYFWTLPASTSGQYHGGELLINHVICCLKIAEGVCESQFKKHWTQRQKDQLYSAIILHDLFRCGEPGKEEYYSEQRVKEKNYDPKIIGTLKSSRDHAEVGFKQILLLAAKWNSEVDFKLRISEKNLKAISEAVRFHLGPFYNNPGKKKFSLSWPADTVTMQMHLIDYHQTNNSYILKKEI